MRFLIGCGFALLLLVVSGCGPKEVTSEDVKSWQEQGSDGDVQTDPNGG